MKSMAPSKEHSMRYHQLTYPALSRKNILSDHYQVLKADPTILSICLMVMFDLEILKILTELLVTLTSGFLIQLNVPLHLQQATKCKSMEQVAQVVA